MDMQELVVVVVCDARRTPYHLLPNFWLCGYLKLSNLVSGLVRNLFNDIML